jgi:hypothetical protein
VEVCGHTGRGIGKLIPRGVLSLPPLPLLHSQCLAWAPHCAWLLAIPCLKPWGQWGGRGGHRAAKILVALTFARAADLSLAYAGAGVCGPLDLEGGSGGLRLGVSWLGNSGEQGESGTFLLGNMAVLITRNLMEFAKVRFSQ